MEHAQISLVCAPQCQTSCTAVCPPSCCIALSQQYRGAYSSPALPLPPVYTNHCPSPCPSSCAPKCSPKCCNAVIYRSQLYLKRKVIGRKSVKKKNRLRKLPKLHQLKKAIKLSQNWGELGVSETNHFLTSYDMLTYVNLKIVANTRRWIWPRSNSVYCGHTMTCQFAHRDNGKLEQNMTTMNDLSYSQRSCIISPLNGIMPPKAWLKWLWFETFWLFQDWNPT